MFAFSVIFLAARSYKPRAFKSVISLIKDATESSASLKWCCWIKLLGKLLYSWVYDEAFWMIKSVCVIFCFPFFYMYVTDDVPQFLNIYVVVAFAVDQRFLFAYIVFRFLESWNMQVITVTFLVSKFLKSNDVKDVH